MHNIQKMIKDAESRVKAASKQQDFDNRCQWLAIRTKAFNAQRAHKHPATMKPARRAKLRRS